MGFWRIVLTIIHPRLAYCSVKALLGVYPQYYFNDPRLYSRPYPRFLGPDQKQLIRAIITGHQTESESSQELFYA